MLKMKDFPTYMSPEDSRSVRIECTMIHGHPAPRQHGGKKMPNYGRWLEYYANSEDFIYDLEDFLELFFHDIYFESIDGRDGNYYRSEICLKIQAQIEECQGQPARFLMLPRKQQWLHSYFTRNRSTRQVFSIVFGLWWHLNEAQIHAIHTSSAELCQFALNYFLCNPDETELPDEDTLRNCFYKGKYMCWKRGCSKCEDGVWVDPPAFLVAAFQ